SWTHGGLLPDRGRSQLSDEATTVHGNCRCRFHFKTSAANDVSHPHRARPAHALKSRAWILSRRLKKKKAPGTAHNALQAKPAREAATAVSALTPARSFINT